MRREICSSAGEGFQDGRCQHSAIEIKLPRQEPDVEEILHAAVQDAQLDHGLELLGDHALSAVAAKLRCREAEDRGIFHKLSRRDHHVAEADVKLHGNARGVQPSPKPDPYPFIVSILGDSLSPDASRVEDQAIRLDLLKARFPHHGDDGVHAVVGPTKEVDVHRGAGEWRLPHQEHQGALENELLGVRALGQPVEEPFHGEVLEQLVEGASCFLSFVEQTLAYGGGNVLDRAFGHSSASR